MTRTVTRAGVRLAYDVAGTAGSRAPGLLFIHGWAGDRSLFAPQYEHFGARRAVATMDLRGHGESDHPDPTPGLYDVETLADDALAVAAAAGLAEPVLVGHSLGALVALAGAARSSQVRAVVMIDPAPITNDGVKQFFRDSVDTCRSDQDSSWRRDFVSGMFMATDRVRREEIVEVMCGGRPDIAAALLLAMADFDGAATFAQVAVPVLSVGSASPTNASRDLRELCPTLTIGQTVGAGHFNHLEVPEQVHPMIERFLDVNRV